MNEQHAISIVRKLAQKFASLTTYIHVLNIPTILDDTRECAIFIGSSVEDDDMVIITEAGSMQDYDTLGEENGQNVSEQVLQ